MHPSSGLRDGFVGGIFKDEGEIGDSHARRGCALKLGSGAGAGGVIANGWIGAVDTEAGELGGGSDLSGGSCSEVCFVGMLGLLLF